MVAFMAAQTYFNFDNPSAERTSMRVAAIGTRNESAAVALAKPRRNDRLIEVLRCLAANPGTTRTAVAHLIGCKETGVCQAFLDAMNEVDEHNGVSRPLVEIVGKRLGDSGRNVDAYQLTGRGHGVLIEELTCKKT